MNMSQPTLAILDGDIIAYKAAFWAESMGPEDLDARLQHDVAEWLPAGCTSSIIALSCRRKDNFRRHWLPEYKANREGKVTPTYLGDAIQFLRDNYRCVEADQLEADDLMGINKAMGTHVCVTVDKDLLSVPGWSMNPNKLDEGLIYTPLQTADFNFYRQWLTGDSTDGVAGCWKVGPKKAEDILNEATPVNWEAAALATYEQRPNKDGGRYTWDEARAMGVAVRILRSTDEWAWKPSF